LLPIWPGTNASAVFARDVRGAAANSDIVLQINFGFTVRATNSRHAQGRELLFKVARDFCYAALDLPLNINTQFFTERFVFSDDKLNQRITRCFMRPRKFTMQGRKLSLY
jgi:hypothetical protein